MNQPKRYFSIDPLDIDKFIEYNECKPITNAIFFDASGSPTSDGLLSNHIFGITMKDRANTFGYIHLGGEYFLHPLYYQTWKTVDRNIVKCIHGSSNFVIDKSGYLVESEDGETGLGFLRKNLDRIKWKQSESSVRKVDIEFLEKYKKLAFIKNYLVIPAYYRDVLSTERYVGVGDINKLYAQLIMAVRSLTELDKYGISVYDANKGRIQEIIQHIFEYLTQGKINGERSGTGIAGKAGLLLAGGQSKTTDYSSRMVIVAPNLKVEAIDDMMVDEDHAAVPMASVIVNYLPYVLSYLRKFFENEYLNNSIREYTDVKTGKTYKVKLKDIRLAFSDDVLKAEMDRFVHGIADRFRPIYLPTEDHKYPRVTIRFTGRTITKEEALDPTKITADSATGISNRPMTWCDLLYMACVDVSRDKYVLITRYPIDSCYNQYPIGINVNSTIKTEIMLINGTIYKWYPRIRREDIGSNTTNSFVDTCMLPNTSLNFIRGDYDGDTVTSKSLYSIEANHELKEQLDSKRHYISFGGTNIATTSNEGMECLYNLTMNLAEDEKKFTDPVF